MNAIKTTTMKRTINDYYIGQKVRITMHKPSFETQIEMIGPDSVYFKVPGYENTKWLGEEDFEYVVPLDEPLPDHSQENEAEATLQILDQRDRAIELLKEAKNKLTVHQDYETAAKIRDFLKEHGFLATVKPENPFD